jgi:hypothetical protein
VVSGEASAGADEGPTLALRPRRGCCIGVLDRRQKVLPALVDADALEHAGKQHAGEARPRLAGLERLHRVPELELDRQSF